MNREKRITIFASAILLIAGTIVIAIQPDQPAATGFGGAMIGVSIGFTAIWFL